MIPLQNPMGGTGATLGSKVPEAADVLRQLDRVLAHSLFKKSQRLSAFLRYAVERTLAGQADSLKETVIGAEVFERGFSFNPQTDNVVRVTANRLRGRLAEYYHSDGKLDPVAIDFPRGGYVPLFSSAPAVNRGPAPIPANLDGRKSSVGRQNELAQIRAAFDSVVRGSGSMFIVSGDAGLGKSTLIEEFLSEVQTEARLLWIGRGSCSERLAKTDPFVPVLECLDDLTRGEDGVEALHIMETVAPIWLSQLVPARDSPSRISARDYSSERLRREFVRFFEALSAIRPIVLVVDDLHWIDESSCDLLTCLASRLEETRIFIVGAYRLPEVFATHPFLPLKLALERHNACTEIRLKFLTAGDTETYLNRRFPDNRFPAGLAAVVYERTEGNPLFMKDMLSFLVNRCLVSDGDGRWELKVDLSQIRSVIPSGVESMIQLQIEHFSEVERRILQCGAVQGMEFDSAVVSRVLAMDTGEVEERLQELERRHRFVRSVGERRFTDRTFSIRYRFVHVFYQNALFAGLVPTRRAAYSIAVAESLLQLAGETGAGMAAEIALLFECGRETERASRQYLQAARNAAAVFGYPEAAILCGHGLRNLLSLPDTGERDALELEFSLVLGMAQMATCGYAAPEVERTYRRSRDLCVRLGETRRLVRVLWAIHTCLVNGGDLLGALELAREMRQVADALGNPASTIESFHALGTTLAFLGRVGEARQALEKALSLFPAGDHKWRSSLYILDSRVTCLSMLARVLARAGGRDQALEKAMAAVDLANHLAHPPTVAYATFWLGWTRHSRGEYVEACRQLEEAMDLSRRYGLPQFLEWGRVLHGASLVHLGNLEDGVSEMRRSLDNQTAMRCFVERPFCLTLLAEGLLLANESSEALALCEEALQIADRTGGRSYEAETRRIREQAIAALSSPLN